jgi:hypothetical protein
MDRFEISDKPNGPWLALYEYQTPQQALEAGKASFQWPVVYVAKMRKIDPSDVMRRSFIMDMTEDLTLRHGNALAEDIMNRLLSSTDQIINSVWDAIEKALEGDPIWVADMIHKYDKDQNVRPADFNKEMQAEISQKKTREAIEAQKERKKEDAEEIKKIEEGALKPKLEDLM